MLWIRTEKNYRRRVEQFGAFVPTESADGADALTDERLARLYSAIHQLKPLERSLILLSLDGLSYRDMAEVLSVRTAQSHSKWIGALYVIVTPLLILAMQQLHAVGKVSARELTSMACFFGATLLLCGVVIATRYFGRLRPQQKQLEEVLRQFSQGASN